MTDNPSDRDSGFFMERKECSKCGAVWLNGVHMWKTGFKGNELDLAGLVCNAADAPECINPMKGQEGGDTWEKRLAAIDALMEAKRREMDR